MKLQDMRIRVENDSQMRIALTILKELTGLPLWASGSAPDVSPEEYVRKYPSPNVVGVNMDTLASWGDAKIGWSGNLISFEDFMREVPQLTPSPKKIIIRESNGKQHVVEFSETGIKVGCTTITKEIVEAIWSRLNGK